MRVRLAAFAVCVAACAVAFPTAAADDLTLNDAMIRVADSHPDLRLFGARSDVLAAERDRALLRPALIAGATVENAFGSGESSGLQGAELTLTLASVLERGGKLDARRTLAQSRIDALAIERETRRLDLLAEVARRYLAVVAAQKQREIAQQDIAQRQRTVAGARQRMQAGASPESVVLTAQAALARAELDRARAEQRLIAARQHLAALWGERDPDFDVVARDPLKLPAIDDFSSLAELVKSTPELVQFADEQRIREARLQLARSGRAADLDWQVGVRRLQATDDFGLVGSVSMPLGSRTRAQPEIRVAEAELASLEIEREAKGLALYSTLAEAHGRYRVAQVEVQRLQNDVLPKLAQAETAAERAYRAGAISYLEWAQLQSERTTARKQQLDAALDAQRALIEIQRLTGQAFIAAPAATTAQGISL
ncbi:MAG: TolC family protein [Xanthomonadales bacterium]|nr:TolC family protein [Xanthomonadales bacterium]